MESSFEEFTQNVIHPLESLSLSGTARISTRNQAPELEPLPLPLLRRSDNRATQRLSNLLPKKAGEKSVAEFNSRRKRGYSPRGNQLRLANMGLETWSLPSQRPRANTSEDKSRPHPSKTGVILLHVHACILRNLSLEIVLYGLQVLDNVFPETAQCQRSFTTSTTQEIQLHPIHCQTVGAVCLSVDQSIFVGQEQLAPHQHQSLQVLFRTEREHRKGYLYVRICL